MMFVASLGTTEQGSAGAGWAIMMPMSHARRRHGAAGVMPAWMSVGQRHQPGELDDRGLRGRDVAAVLARRNGRPLCDPRDHRGGRLRARRPPLPRHARLTSITMSQTPTAHAATPSLDLDRIRAAFPALSARPPRATPSPTSTDRAAPRCPTSWSQAMADYLLHHNANTHWAFPTSEETDAALADAARDARRLPARARRRSRLRRQHDDADLPPGRALGAALGPGRRDRRHRARSPRQRRPLARRWSGSGASPSAPRRMIPETGRARLGRPGARRSRADAAAGDRGGVERPRHDQRRRRGGALAHARRRPGLRRRRPLRAARAGRRAGARLRLPGLLGVQVLRAARRRPLRPARLLAIARRPEAAARARHRAGAAGDRHAEPRGDRRRPRRRSTSSPRSAARPARGLGARARARFAALHAARRRAGDAALGRARRIAA